MKKECEIVKDLFPNYIEKQISDVSKEFIENHISNCKECKEMLEMISGKKSSNLELDENEKKEIDFLKKYNKKIKSLKTIVILLVICIICALGVKSIQSIYRYYNGRYVIEIISKVHENTQNFKNQDNFYFALDDSKSKVGFYYKDKKSKQKPIYSNNEFGNFTIYGMMNENDMITIFIDEYSKTVNGKIDNGQEEKEYLFKNTFKYLDSLREENIMECGNIKVTEQTYDGVKCWVLTKVSKTGGFIMVIDKENRLIQKYAEVSSNGKYSWSYYEYETGTVTDEDMQIKNLEGYKLDDITQNYLNQF